MFFYDIEENAYTRNQLEGFENLYIRVGKIDKEAEQFLRELLNNPQESYDNYDFTPNGALPSCFVFGKTPQGIEYWWYILEKLDGFEKSKTCLSNEDWVSVEDELPNIGTCVLVYLSDKGFQEVPYIVTKFDKYGFNISNVTHWKHLVPPEGV